MWKYLLSQLLNPFWSFFAQNPAARLILLGGLLTGLFVFGTKQCSRAEKAERELKSQQALNQSLTKVNRDLVSQRDKATSKADSIQKANENRLQVIKRQVEAMPATERTKLNRQLLTSLGLAQ